MSIFRTFTALPRRLGVVFCLVAVTFCAVMVTGGVITAVMLDRIRESLLEDSQLALESNLGTLKALLAQQGREWRLEGDQLLLDGKPLNGRNEVVDTVKAVAGGVATLFAGDTRVATNVMTADGKRAVGTKLAQGPAYDAVFRRGETYRGVATILGAPHQTIYEPIRDTSGRVIGLLFVGRSLASVEARILEVEIHGIIVGAISLVVVGLFAWMATGMTLRPLRGLAQAVQSIAEGRFDLDPPCTDRRDLLGEIGRAVKSLAEGSRQARALEAEAEAARQRSAAERRQMQQSLAEEIEQAVGGVARALSTEMAKLDQAAHTLSEGTSRAQKDAGAVADRSRSATQNVQAVATAAEQLSASIAEINRRVSQGAQVARAAVAAAGTSDQTVAGLSAAADRIGDVVKLIADIAGQTNLLALNATIEAARAGEAGKGFAVVASEVKTLASQTARATEEIATQIGAMRGATNQAVLAVRDIATTVSRMDEVTSAIAAAVEEQGAATQEIARNAAAAAHGTEGAAQSTLALTEHVTQAADALGGVRQATSAVGQQGAALQRELSGVVARLRAA
ncbi:cache domain-containing protein [Roseomonas sp. GC11]|uniref:methyl-accepting chemotaxis protein n=1 Tax=Roseomonas sp. GC11 TaxID=2950546 RepID=UPI00210E57EF|nr:cache domain-containing protein [Roseomonas sp. GC11]MCQ4161770.1 cache domain-containing protein [Roseomonas sp. GC11]